MNYVESFNLLGVEAKQIPCIKGEGVPTATTEGEVGCFYMDTLTGTLYKCTAISDGTYIWVSFGGEIVQSASKNNIPVSGYAYSNNQLRNNASKYKGAALPVQPNTDYKIIVSGAHNRFYIGGYAEDTLVVDHPVTPLWNSNDTTERNTTESATVNSGDYKYLIIVAGYTLTGTPILEYVEDEEVKIMFGDYRVYTSEKVDEMIDSTKNNYFYTTKRDVENVNNTATLYSLYDELVANHPDYVTKNLLGQNSLGTDIYEYVFTTGDYNSKTTQRNKDSIIKKPTFLVTAGIHGYERSAVMSIYKFFKDLVTHSAPLYTLRNAVTFKVIPVVVPHSFDNDIRVNENGVNINRNFATNWTSTETGNNYSGASAADQAETQIVQAWLNNNGDAYIYVDCHNSAYVDEVVMAGDTQNGNIATDFKNMFLKSFAKIESYLKNEKNYSDDLIYAYSGYFTEGGISIGYATSINIPSLIIESSWSQNSTGLHSSETIAAGAEIIGNMFIEMHNNCE